MNLTVKQISVLRVIVAKNEDGSFVDLDQLLDRIDYETTKASMQFSIRSLVKNGFIVKDDDNRRGRRHVIYKPTEVAHRVLGREPRRSAMVLDEADALLLEELETLL